MTSHIFDSSIDNLYTSIEEGARAGKKNTNRFIEPAQGTLNRAKSKRHHLVFGRRGSGKSSLLYKSAEELANNGHPVALVDLEPFKGHQYPDIIISVLIASFQKFSFWLDENIAQEKDRRLWYTLFLKKTTSKQKSRKIELQKSFNSNIEELKTQLHLIDNADLKQKVNTILKEAENQSYLAKRPT